MAQLYANENYPLAVVDELRRLGHDVTTTQDIGNAGRSVPDDQVLQTAIGMRRAVLTHNRRDFMRLHRRVPNHAGIVVCTVDQNWIALAQRIHDKLVATGDLAGQLVRINKPHPSC